MAKKHKFKIRGWHNPPKYVEHGSYAKCNICKKRVKNIEAHIAKVHREIT